MIANKDVTVILTDIDEQEIYSMPRLRLALISGIIHLTVINEHDQTPGFVHETIAELAFDYKTFIAALAFLQNEENFDPEAVLTVSEMLSMIHQNANTPLATVTRLHSVVSE